MPIGPASILCLDGPDPNSGSQPAYLHVFFYDKDKIFRKTTKLPHVIQPCPCAIFYNVDYYRYRFDKTAKFALSHETGHILGLCKSPEHGDGAHCTNHGCLMRRSPGRLTSLDLLFGIPLKDQLCNDCQSDLEMGRSEDIGSKLTFNGPFLIRREDGYSVASLAYCDFLIPESLEEEFDGQEMLLLLKEKIQGVDFSQYWKNEWMHRFWGLCRPDDNDDSWQSTINYMDILTRAAEDPDPFVSRKAAAELEKLKQEQQKQESPAPLLPSH